MDLEPGLWHNLVLIYNRTRSGFLSNRSLFSIFIDGVEVSTTTITWRHRSTLPLPLPPPLEALPRSV